MKTILLGALLFLAVIKLSTAKRACILWDKNGINNAGCVVDGEIEENATLLCSLAPADSFIISMKGAEFDSKQKFDENCKIVNPSAYIWVSVEIFQKHIQPTLEITEGQKFFGCVFELESKKFNNCNVDLATAQCISNENTNLNATHILIEKLPIRYKLRDAVYSTWKNTTMLNKINLETITQTNNDSSEKILEQEVGYNYESRIELEFPIRIVKNNLIQVYEDGKVSFHLDAGFRSSEIVQKKTKIINNISGMEMATVDLEGVWGKTATSFVGKLVIVYEDAPKAVEDKIIDITGTKIVTEIIEISNQVVQLKKLEVEKKSDVAIESSSSTTNIYVNVAPSQNPAGGIYSEFRPYFQLACVVFFGTCLYFAVDVLRVWIKYRKEKRAGKEYAFVSGS